MRPRVAWIAYACVAAALAALGIGHWVWALTLGGPVLYGEGAVAHAAILARDGLEYTAGARYGTESPIFTAANYPPLYFHLAGIGDPFVTGRALSIAATLFVAGVIAWRARPAGALVAGAIALAWLGSVPVLLWGPAVKPDLLALGLTVGAVLALDRPRPMYVVAGALVGIAAMAKPTALLPGIAMWLYAIRERPAGATYGLLGGIVAAIAVALLTHGPDKLAKVHVVDWNALPWRSELAAPLVLLALIVLAVPLVTIALTRPSRTIVTAYAAGSAAILLLGGREGATINYFLDLSAAIALAICGRAPRLASSVAYPAVAIAQAVIVVLLIDPFGVVPGATPSTGRWGDPARIAILRDVPGTLLVEDSGLLVASGREPLVDDLFLWSRNHATGASFLEGDRVLRAVRDGRFDAVVSEVDLARISSAPGFEQQRWHPDLVAAVLERYVASAPRVYGSCASADRCDALFIYTRRGR